MNKSLENNPLVSIITVNFRQSAVTCDLLRSLRKISYPNTEVIVVDNGSQFDATPDFKKELPEVKVLISEENLGFAGGNNLGIQASKGEFLFFINNDTEVEDGLIENLLKRFDSPAIGAVSPKICYFDSPDIIQYAGFSDINPLTGRNKTIGKGEADHGQYDTARPVPFAHGAAMMVRSAVVEKVGEMPENYFLYYEEIDWCMQIRRAGFEIWYEPAVRILHKESLTTGKESPLKMYFLTRNRITFMIRNYQGYKLAAFLVFFYLISLPKNLVLLLLGKEYSLLKTFIKGASDPLVNFISSIYERDRIYRVPRNGRGQIWLRIGG
ncbi:MAG: glycosyltransferase family 2 protein [Saprospiraceae bacterium]